MPLKTNMWGDFSHKIFWKIRGIKISRVKPKVEKFYTKTCKKIERDMVRVIEGQILKFAMMKSDEYNSRLGQCSSKSLLLGGLVGNTNSRLLTIISLT